jgi:hypothetical protein
MANEIENFLQEETQRLTGIIDALVTPSSPWLSQIRKKTWKGQIGHVISNVRWERSFPDTEKAWTQYVSSTTPGTNNICLPVTESATFAQTVRTTNLAAKAIESPDFCVEDLRVKWKRDEQLGNVTRTLEQMTKEYMLRRNRMSYAAACDSKIIPTATGFVTTGETSVVNDVTSYNNGDAIFADEIPASIMTQSMLDSIHIDLDRENAGTAGVAQSGGGYIYKLVTSAEHSSYIRKGNSEIREDFRNSGHADILLKGLGITHTYGGYAHVIDPQPRRFTKYESGDAEYTDAAVVGADGSDTFPLVSTMNGWFEERAYAADGSIRSEYKNANYEMGAILVTSVLDCLVPAPLSAVGRAKFKAQNYAGEYIFNNIKDRDTNPDGTLGYFRGKIVNGFQTRHPERGVVFIHQVAPLSLAVDDVLA